MHEERHVDWVEVRRFDDPIAAEMASDFLREHGIDVATRGNSGVTGMLNRFVTVVDIRLVVPADQAEEARDALDALDVGASVEQPFRGRAPAPGAQRAPEDEEEAHEAPSNTKRALLVALVATFVPAAAMVAGGVDEGRAAARRPDALRVEQLESEPSPHADPLQADPLREEGPAVGPLRQPRKPHHFRPAEGRGTSAPP